MYLLSHLGDQYRATTWRTRYFAVGTILREYNKLVEHNQLVLIFGGNLRFYQQDRFLYGHRFFAVRNIHIYKEVCLHHHRSNRKYSPSGTTTRVHIKSKVLYHTDCCLRSTVGDSLCTRGGPTSPLLYSVSRRVKNGSKYRRKCV